MKKIILTSTIIIFLSAGCGIFRQAQDNGQIVPQHPQKPVSDNSQPPQTQVPQPTEDIFVNLDKSLQKKEGLDKVAPEQGFIITTSLLSNNKDKVAYAEISDCIASANSYDWDEKSKCESYQYRILVKDLNSGKTNKIYSEPEEQSSLFIKTAYAGGCPLTPFPLAWSKNDKKIILKLGNPTSCGSGGYVRIFDFAINPAGGKLEDLDYGDGIFFDNFSQAVYADYSEEKYVCGSVAEAAGSKIILKNIETGESKILKKDASLGFKAEAVDEKKGELAYSQRTIKKTGQGCYEYGPSGEKTLTLQLPH